MHYSVTVFAQAVDETRKLPFSEWGFGAITLAVFAFLAIVMWSYRDVAHRHARPADPHATEHAGAPGVSSHGSGDKVGHHQVPHE